MMNQTAPFGATSIAVGMSVLTSIGYSLKRAADHTPDSQTADHRDKREHGSKR